MRRVSFERFQLLLFRRIVVLDTSGAGDVFHGAYVYSYLADASKSWEEHFRFGRAASTYKIQHLGNEAGLPTVADIVTTEREFKIDNRPAPIAELHADR